MLNWSLAKDHGLPLVQLNEQRRDLVVALMGRRPGPISKEQIADIAAIQQAIACMEAIIVDLETPRCSLLVAEDTFDKSSRLDHFFCRTMSAETGSFASL